MLKNLFSILFTTHKTQANGRDWGEGGLFATESKITKIEVKLIKGKGK